MLSSKPKEHVSTKSESTTLKETNTWKDKQTSGRANNPLAETVNNPEEADNSMP
jgi:hypothetical protein